MDKAKQKPPQEAVAIRYDRDRENAPRVVAKGKGYVAEQLLGSTEQAGRSDDMVAGTAQRHDQRQDGRHARGRRDARLRAFKRRQP